MSDDAPEQINPDSIQRIISEGRARQLDRAVDQIEALTAERDGLREQLAALLDQQELIGIEHAAERDRLRAVVRKAKEFVAARARWHAEVERSSAVPPVEFQRDYDDTQMALVDAVSQLDGHGDMGGEGKT